VKKAAKKAGVPEKFGCAGLPNNCLGNYDGEKVSTAVMAG
jgi:hypothetical protein